MQKATKLALAGSMAATAIIAPVQALASTGTSAEVGTVTATKLYVRASASTSGKVLGSLTKGETVTILSKANGWGKISFNGSTGYVSMEYIQTTATSTTAAVTADADSATVTASTLNVRTTPSKNGVISDTLKKGTEVRVVSTQDGWAQITYNGKQGYVSLEYLDITKTASTTTIESAKVTATKLNVRATASTSGTLLGNLSKGTVVTIVAKANGWAQITYNGQNGYVSLEYLELADTATSSTTATTTGTATTTTTTTATESGTVTATTLNVRASASMSAAVLGTLKQGAAVSIISQGDGWAKISYNGATGYVSLAFIDIDEEEASTSVEGTITATLLNVRKTASLQAEVVGTLKKGDAVTVLSQDSTWAQIAYNGGTAYVSLKYVSFASATTDTVIEQKTVTVSEALVKAQASSSSTTLGVLSKGDKVDIVGVAGDWLKVKYNSQEAYVQAAAFEEKVEEEYGTVTATSLNLRATPSTSGSIVGKLSKGATITIVSKADGWAKVQYNGSYAYASLDYLTLGTRTVSYTLVTAAGKLAEASWDAAANALASVSGNAYVIRDGTIVNMNKGFVRTKGVVSIYSETTSKQLTYVAANTDLQFVKSTGDRITVSIDGIVGYVSLSDVTLYPSLLGESTSYYTVKSGKLYYYAYNPSSKTYYSYEIGNAPSHLQEGVKYDAYNETAIGGSDSYQYFQFMSLRTPSSYTAQEINNFIKTYNASSPLNGTGAYFVAAANAYHVNVGYLLAHAILESGWGTSSIAKNKNNLFGFGAVDSNPYAGAASFSTLQEGINYCAKYISNNYLQPSGVHYNGALIGDKAIGMNVKYASDSNWGQQIASLMHKLDKMYSNRSVNQYKLGLVQADASLLTAVGGAKASTVESGMIVTIKGSVQASDGLYYELVSDNSSYNSVYIAAKYIKLVSSY